MLCVELWALVVLAVDFIVCRTVSQLTVIHTQYQGGAKDTKTIENPVHSSRCNTVDNTENQTVLC